MTTLGNKLSKFKAYITLDSTSVNPAYEDFSSDFSKYQAALSNDASASRVFGMDFLMFAEGGFFKTGTGLSKASGIFNYGQAITHRLLTHRGTMPGDPLFGVPWGNYLGRSYRNKNPIIASLSQDISEEVFKDPRTGSIYNIDVSFKDINTIEVGIVLIPVLTNFSDRINILISNGV